MEAIEQKIRFKHPPNRIFDLLMNSKKHSAFTQSKASIPKRVGGLFTAYDGYVSGVNIEIVPNKRIVQAWRGLDFPSGVYSIVYFKFESRRGGGTELTLAQYGVPENLHKHVSKGWYEHYWDKMKSYLGE